jgi:hypothetical protein
MRRTRTLLLTIAVISSACSAPSLQPLYVPGTLVQDPGLVGEWATDGPTVARVVLSEGKDGKYLGALTIHRDGQLKAGLALEVSLTQIGEDRYVDLYLDKREREALAGRYGFLALPVHQFMMIKRDGDEATAWMFNADWLRRAAADNAFACEVVPVAGQDIAVITADSGSLGEFLRVHAHDPGALLPPLVFRRMTPAR